MIFPTSAYASGSIIQILGDYEYVERYMDEWCWVATGLNLFTGVNDGYPSKEDIDDYADFQLELVKEVVRNSDGGLRPGSGQDDFEKYNISAGLSYTEEVVNTLLDEYGYDDVSYSVVQPKLRSQGVVRSFDRIMTDIEDGYPLAIWLYPTDKSSNSYHHIVMICGVDSTWDDESDYDVLIYDSDKGSLKWVNYEDLVNGNAKQLNYKQYDGTCEANY